MKECQTQMKLIHILVGSIQGKREIVLQTFCSVLVKQVITHGHAFVGFNSDLNKGLWV
jgi:hypothetical protein